MPSPKVPEVVGRVGVLGGGVVSEGGGVVEVEGAQAYGTCLVHQEDGSSLWGTESNLN